MKKASWGSYEGTHISKFAIGKSDNLQIEVSDFGARLLSCKVPIGSGQQKELLVGLRNADEYGMDEKRCGAMVGRFGSRVREGRFTLNGRAYRLSRNTGTDHRFGGTIGFDKRVWHLGSLDHDSVSFVLVSTNGDEGYPGTLITHVTYTVVGNVLRYEISATADLATPVSIFSQAYWNLSDGDCAHHHHFQIDADFYVPYDEAENSSGEILSVNSKPTDFRSLRPASTQEPKEFAQNLSKPVVPIDFVLNHYSGDLRRVGRILDPHSKRSISLATTEPCLHLSFDDRGDGRSQTIAGGAGNRTGFTLSTQGFPDAPNWPHFPSSILQPGVTYRHITELSLEF